MAIAAKPVRPPCRSRDYSDSFRCVGTFESTRIPVPAIDLLQHPVDIGSRVDVTVGGKDRGEGSILGRMGGIGGFFDGN